MKKAAILLSVALMCQCHTVFGQNIAFADTRLPDYGYYADSGIVHHHQKHCVTTRIGEGFLLTGGAVFVGSLVEAGVTTDNNDLAVPALMLGGIFLGGIGAIVLSSGKAYERHHKQKFSMFSKGNRLGLAYSLGR